MPLHRYKISIIVTGVTGLLRAFLLPRNTFQALPFKACSHTVTAVTGFLYTRTRVKKLSLNIFITWLCFIKAHCFCFFTRVRKTPVTLLTLVTIIDLYNYFKWCTRNKPLTIVGLPVTMAIKQTGL